MEKRGLVGIGVALASAALLAGCGSGGSSDSVESSPQTIVAQGVYFGSYTINGQSGSVPVSGAILPNGYAYFADGNGVLYVLPSGIKSGSIKGKLTAYAPIDEVFTSGQAIEIFSLYGSAEDNGSNVTTIKGEFSGANESGNFSLDYQEISMNTPPWRRWPVLGKAIIGEAAPARSMSPSTPTAALRAATDMDAPLQAAYPSFREATLSRQAGTVPETLPASEKDPASASWTTKI